MSLGSLEIEILNAIWTLQDENEDRNISVKDIVDFLENNDLQRAYTTVKTVMDRLSLKEILVRYRSGKKFFYRSVLDRKEMALNAVQTLKAQFFNNSSIELIKFIEKECIELVVE